MDSKSKSSNPKLNLVTTENTNNQQGKKNIALNESQKASGKLVSKFMASELSNAEESMKSKVNEKKLSVTDGAEAAHPDNCEEIAVANNDSDIQGFNSSEGVSYIYKNCSINHSSYNVSFLVASFTFVENMHICFLYLRLKTL